MSVFRVLTLACVVAAVTVATGATPMPRVTGADAAAVSRAAREVADREPGWRRAARMQFPGDRWSQDDAFHNVEQNAVRMQAARAGVSVGELFDALDRELRAHAGGHLMQAVPCKPRPFYD
ncbi:MAG: hypothetical protein GXP55_20515 [Deltaproteobacteria bacterium]|nr:hypothetical protein [Deltaproteobacteria bacterium]